MKSSNSLKLSQCKIQVASVTRNWINSVPQTAGTTFASSSVFILLLWSEYIKRWLVRMRSSGPEHPLLPHPRAGRLRSERLQHQGEDDVYNFSQLFCLYCACAAYKNEMFCLNFCLRMRVRTKSLATAALYFMTNRSKFVYCACAEYKITSYSCASLYDQSHLFGLNSSTAHALNTKALRRIPNRTRWLATVVRLRPSVTPTTPTGDTQKPQCFQFFWGGTAFSGLTLSPTGVGLFDPQNFRGMLH